MSKPIPRRAALSTGVRRLTVQQEVALAVIALASPGLAKAGKVVQVSESALAKPRPVALQNLTESKGTAPKPFKGFLKENREQVLTQYADHGNALQATRKTRATLEAGMYEIRETMEGLFFEKTNVSTDELLKFEDSRYNVVTEEIDSFWGLGQSFKEMGLTHKRGVLMFGPPGTGKSCLLKQVIESAIAADTVCLVGSRRMDTVVGALRQIKEVEADRKVLVVMEDMDEICSYNEHSVLEMMDGGNQMDGVLVLGTTNYPERLPPRVLRSGRFDTKIEVKSLPLEGRRAYFAHKLAARESEERIEEISEKTDGFSFAQMRELLASVYCYNYGLDESVDRIRKNLRESKPMMDRARGTVAMAQLVKQGYMAESALKPAIDAWKADVRKRFAEARFQRVDNRTLQAVVGGGLGARVSIYSEATGEAQHFAKPRLSV